MSGKEPPGPYGFDNLPQPLPLRAYQNMSIVLRAGLLLTVILFVAGLLLFFVERPGESLARLFSSLGFPIVPHARICHFNVIERSISSSAPSGRPADGSR